MSSIALFGGGFDPPHRGHSTVATVLLQTHQVDEVWFVPVKQHPFGKKVSADHHRVNMLEAMIQAQDKALQSALQIEKYELHQSGPSYSYQTLKALQAKYPHHIFSWIIGSDNLVSFTKWAYYQEMLSEFTVWVYPRVGFPLEPLLPGMKPLQEVPEVAVSSTLVRRLVSEHTVLPGLVEPTVETYIKEQQLYQEFHD